MFFEMSPFALWTKASKSNLWFVSFLVSKNQNPRLRKVKNGVRCYTTWYLTCVSASLDLQTSEQSRKTWQSWAQELWELEGQEPEEEVPGQIIRQQSTAWWWREWTLTSTPWRSNMHESKGGSSSRLCNSTYAQVGARIYYVVLPCFNSGPLWLVTICYHQMSLNLTHPADRKDLLQHYIYNDTHLQLEVGCLMIMWWWLIGPGPEVTPTPSLPREGPNNHSNGTSCHTDGTNVEPKGHWGWFQGLWGLFHVWMNWKGYKILI